MIAPHPSPVKSQPEKNPPSFSGLGWDETQAIVAGNPCMFLCYHSPPPGEGDEITQKKIFLPFSVQRLPQQPRSL